MDATFATKAPARIITLDAIVGNWVMHNGMGGWVHYESGGRGAPGEYQLVSRTGHVFEVLDPTRQTARFNYGEYTIVDC